MTIQGGCLCGKVRYQINGPLVDADHCHCSMCRRQHGAAFATYAGFKPGDFEWLAGADLIKIYDPSEAGGWCFCSVCGSTLAGTDKGQITSVTLGTADGDPKVHPTAHIFVASRAAWYEIHDKLAQFEHRPPANWKPSSNIS